MNNTRDQISQWSPNDAINPLYAEICGNTPPASKIETAIEDLE